MYVYIFLLYSFGQLPKECTLDKVVFDFECCPNTSSGICGGDIRGSCENVTTTTDQCQDSNNRERKYCKVQEFLRSRPGTGNTDFRYKWPSQIFQRVCVCKANYDGYNCMRCKRGYSGDDCSQPLAPVERKNILSLTELEKQSFIDIIQMTKSVTASGYTVPIREPVTAIPSESFVEISLYNIFATFHYNTIRDEPINKCPNTSLIQSFCNEDNKCPIPDFGHEGPGFLTWHRGYLLYVETEIQRMLNDPTFALPYWDWTDENKRDEIWNLMGRSNCGVFSNPPNDALIKAELENQSPFSTWDTICTNIKGIIICNENNQVCNPTENFDRIQRCIGGIQDIQCWVDRTLPSQREVSEALKERSYDTPPYDIDKNLGGFRNALEGFKMLVERNTDLCSSINVPFRHAELHNRVHIYIGGNMLSVPEASNDPIFFLHHCNVDRLYEQWLDQYSDENFPDYEPNTFYHDIGPGHNIDEYLVPMFPLITHRDMHRRATSLGYKYNEVIPQQSGYMRSQIVRLATSAIASYYMNSYIYKLYVAINC